MLKGWLLIIAGLGVNGNLSGTQSTQYSTKSDCEQAGKAFIQQHPSAQIRVGETKVTTNDLRYSCAPIYAPLK